MLLCQRSGILQEKDETFLREGRAIRLPVEIPRCAQGVEGQPRLRQLLGCQVRYSPAEAVKLIYGPSTATSADNPPEFAAAFKQDPNFGALQDQSEQAAFAEK